MYLCLCELFLLLTSCIFSNFHHTLTSFLIFLLEKQCPRHNVFGLKLHPQQNYNLWSEELTNLFFPIFSFLSLFSFSPFLKNWIKYFLINWAEGIYVLFKHLNNLNTLANSTEILMIFFLFYSYNLDVISLWRIKKFKKSVSVLINTCTY